MEELIPISVSGGRRAVNARDLHRFLESKQEFANWIKNRIDKYGLVENEDYVVFDKFVKNPNGGRPQIEYVLSIDAAKELSMVEGNEKGRQARRYFIECERIAKGESSASLYSIQDKMIAIEYASRILNLNEASRLTMIKAVMDPMGLPTPDYVPSKGVLRSATDLLKANGVEMSAKAFNKIAINKGVLVEKERKSTHGIKRFKNISDGWLDFGENQVCPNNPRETQPLWYESRFRELLERMELI